MTKKYFFLRKLIMVSEFEENSPKFHRVVFHRARTQSLCISLSIFLPYFSIPGPSFALPHNVGIGKRWHGDGKRWQKDNPKLANFWV